MRELATIEVYRLAHELGKFQGYRIDKLYELGEGRFRLRLTNKGDKAYLSCVLPDTLNETSFIEKADTATGFATAFRKRTSGFIITSISQMNRDRIIQIDAEKGVDRISIIFELFGKGNLIIIDKSMAILLAYRRQEFKDRLVASREKYSPPKSTTVDFTSDAPYQISRDVTDESVSRYFASALGIGRTYTEEAITRAGVDPSAPATTMGSRLQELGNSVRELVRDALESEKAIVYIKDGIPIDFSLTSLSKYHDADYREFGSLNEALDAAYSSAAEPGGETAKIMEQSPEIKSVKASIDKQRKAIGILAEESEKYKRAGTAIFNNMDAINDLIGVAAQDRHATAEALQKVVPQGIKVLSVDLKNKKILIDIDGESTQGGLY